MDPNGGKKGVFNKLSKYEAKKRLNLETFSRKTVSFYRYVAIENPILLRDKLYLEWKDLCVLGRIYIANEGINGTIAGNNENISKVITYIKALPGCAKIETKKKYKPQSEFAKSGRKSE